MFKRVISIFTIMIVCTFVFPLFGCEDGSYFSFITDQTTESNKSEESSSTQSTILTDISTVTTAFTPLTEPRVTTIPDTTTLQQSQPMTDIAVTTTVAKTASVTSPVKAPIGGELIMVTKVPGEVKRGSMATLSIKGLPNTVYSIKVKYSSGYSSANGLVDTMSDNEGNCSWTWRIGAKTSPGEYDITISDGVNTYMLKFNVV